MFRKNTRSLTLMISALLALMVLLSACAVSTPVPAQPTTPLLPTATAAVPTTQPQPSDTAAVPTVEVAPDGAPNTSVTLDLNGLADGFTSDVVPAVPASENGPWWKLMPEYTLLTLQGYPISNHLMKPQIFVYPVEGLAMNEIAGQIAADLQALLQTQQVGDNIPFLPLFNAAQVIHPQVKFTDFQNGQGVRFVAWYSQGIVPINNHELFYTYQGITSDGQYYVAAVLPVTLPGLPADASIPANADEWASNYAQYIVDTNAMIAQQDASAFTPDLNTLDAMVQSIEVR